MIYLLANNRQYTTEHLHRLPVQKGDTVIICNLFWNNRLPEWDVKYIWFIRNIRDALIHKWDLSIISYLQPEKIYYVYDPDGNSIVYQEELGIPFEEVPAHYPDGVYKAPSTGWVASQCFPEAVCVGFQKAPHYESKAWHDFDWEHEYIKKNRKNILL